MTWQTMTCCVLIALCPRALAEAGHRHWRSHNGHFIHAAPVSPGPCCGELLPYAASYSTSVPTAAEQGAAATPSGATGMAKLDRRPPWVLSDEDPFLDPAKGRAALHVDVPWDADMKIEYTMADGKRKVSTWTLSRGKHRNFLLEHLPPGRDKLVRVDVHARGRNPDGTSYGHEKIKSVFVVSGDRRYLDFVQDWKVDDGPPRPVVMIVAINEAVNPATKNTVMSPSLELFSSPALSAVVAYDTAKPEAQSFSFAAPPATPKTLQIVHVDESEGAPDFSEMDLERLTFVFNWKKANDSKVLFELPIEIQKSDKDSVFKRASDDKSETLELDFSDKEGGIRGQIEKALPKQLLKADSPDTMTMAAKIKFKGRKAFDAKGLNVMLTK